MTDTNRIKTLFAERSGILSMYTTAGYPTLEATTEVCRGFIAGGADMIELGMPFSDPVADGPTIQETNTCAIENGITVEKIFAAVADVRKESAIPLVLMGHLNTVLQYGVERFCAQCKELGVDGVILPDLPAEEYKESYKELFEQSGLSMIFLVTSETSEERIRYFDELASGFLYVVSSSAVTGSSLELDKSRANYFRRLRDMKLRNPLVVGFGIDSRERFEAVVSQADGAIIASAFLRKLKGATDYFQTARDFVHTIRGTNA